MRTRLLVRAILGCFLTALPVRLTAADRSVQSVIFVLDCSKKMAAELPSEKAASGKEAPTTRLNAAKQAIQTSLERLSSEGGHQAALWLFGHRLAWDDSEQPTLLEQSEYLEKTLGFKVLAKLLPGDDVEIARPLDKLEPRDLEVTFDRLSVVKPWGESPLYLCLARALDNLPADISASEARVIVITDGTNHQWIARYHTSKNRLLDAAERHSLPIHILAFNAEKPNLQQDAELEQIAGQTHGSFQRVDSAAALGAGIEAALRVGRADSEAGVAGAPSASSSVAVVPVAAATAAAAPRTGVLDGKITWYGRGVRKARVTIEGPSLSPTTTDVAGHYSFEHVPAGTFNLVIEATVRNVLHKKSVQFTFDPAVERAATVDVPLD